MRKTLLFVLLIAAACKRSEGVAGLASGPSLSDIPSMVAAAAGHPPSLATSGPQRERMIVRTAQIKAVVSDTQQAMNAVTKHTQTHRGWVAGSNVWRERGGHRGTMSLRVPAENLNAMLASIRHSAVRIDSENITSEEVTEEYVDLESTLRNLEATEVELRQLLVTARQRANKAADILEVHQSLTNIRGEIEKTRGRMRYLSQKATFSAIEVELVPEAFVSTWRPVATLKSAGSALVNALKVIADMSIWLVIYIAPIVALLCAVVAVAWKLVAPLRLRRS